MAHGVQYIEQSPTVVNPAMLFVHFCHLCFHQQTLIDLVSRMD